MHPYSEGLRRFFQSKTPERFRKSCLKKTFTDLFPINHHVLVNAGHIGEGLLHPTPEVTGVALLPLLLGNNLIWNSRIKIPKLNILTVLQMHYNSPLSWCDSFLPRAVESWESGHLESEHTHTHNQYLWYLTGIWKHLNLSKLWIQVLGPEEVISPNCPLLSFQHQCRVSCHIHTWWFVCVKWSAVVWFNVGRGIVRLSSGSVLTV